MKDVTLNQLEQTRLHVLNSVLEHQLPVAQAAEILGVSERHAWRLLAAYRREGAAALAHGNRGRKPRNTVSDDEANAVVQLASTTYAGANHTHLTELLREREGIDLSRPTVRRILTRAGISSPRHRRPPNTGCAGSGCPRRGCWCRSTAVSTGGWATTVPNSPCCWRWTTPPAPWPARCSVPRRTPAATSP
ncbi:MAG: helix-turn-helix domain-containing protein [Acidimicrobiia bacterium]|nr:helix-turn-helix domain-containing protein [Chloroflexota bacterium]MYE67843.1 helix-turn-helix domain-containing protein [Acidimicrobiia bacterium]